ncbi:hypothetical protein XH94_10975 [Bradyrhizobium zhanjiangense]|uniref:Uncharacterized protein n=2 Tax=Bradyrhizobium zhanjiangense TaxID=1325107 RepID=A0A4Q0SQU8_9BRAD|nr:hypothetical protein XH94_10975 [Bradyrhizobium zhanjiangense]
MISGLNDQSQGEYERWQHKTVNVLKHIPSWFGVARRPSSRISMALSRAVAEHALNTFVENPAKYARVLDYRTRIANLEPIGFL